MTSDVASLNTDLERPRRRAREMIGAVRALAPRVIARVGAIESARTLPRDLVDELRELGLFRMVVPKSHGGYELRLRDCCEIVAEVARIDGSIGWFAMVTAFSPLILGMLPPPVYDDVYRNGPDIIVAGSAALGGTVTLGETHDVLNGRWPFASGCQHADWMFGFCLASAGSQPVAGTREGAPPLRIAVLPAREWTIEDTWLAAGLKGTGSHHIVARDRTVPRARVIDPFARHAPGPAALFQAGASIFPTTHAPFAVGLAKGAIDDLLALAHSGKRAMYARTPVKDTPIFQYELGRADAQVRAAAALMHEQCEQDWQDCLAGQAHDPEKVAQRFQAATWITETCAHAVNLCYQLGGGTAVMESSPLQRRARDMLAATQHIAVNARNYLTAGQGRMGMISGHSSF
ncbi:MAG: acyl-CoA dehydrogenase family protein [Gammaproteobacteria bacterium]